MPLSVLVVDDEPTIRRTVSFMARRAGYDVREAVDGEDALRQLRERPADLIVLDVMMPRLNGFDTLSEIREHEELDGTKVLMLTAKGHPDDRQRARDLGANEFETKPFSPMHLGEVIQKLLGTPTSAE